jgi:NAD(P)-dependent dehydrogenase (short-subunit alcohol dehydrogenase family)
MLIRLLCSGGSTGIGAATVKLLVEHGANVVFGDINVAAAHESGTSATFLECDVTKYDDIDQLFKKTYDQYGRIDHAISCAGTFEQGNWFDPNYTIDSIREHPGNTKVLDVNLTGTLHFARIAAVFLRESRQENNNKSLTLLSSVNAFRDSPGLYLYQTSKHAIQGILHSTRKTLHERDGIRVNAVCPGVTDTPMTAAIIQPFKDAGLFWQPAEAVAKVILGILSSKEMNGKAFYVEGGDGFEFEDSLYAAQPQWLGEEATRRMRVNTEAVQKVSVDTERLRGPRLTGFTGCSCSEVKAIYVKVNARRRVARDEKTETQCTAIGATALLHQTVL